METKNDLSSLAGRGSAVDSRKEFSVIALLILYWNHRRLLMSLMLVGLAVSVIYAFVSPALYQSTVTLMPPDPTVFSGGDLYMAASGLGGPNAQRTSSLAGTILGGNSTGDLFLAILQSRTVQDDIINQFDLMRVYHTKTHDDARKILTKNTDAKEEPKSQVIFITVTDRDRRRAQAIANAYVVELDNLVSRLNTSGAHRERVFLEKHLPVLRQELDAASLNLSQFSSRSATLDIDNQAKAILDATAKLQGELIAAKTDLSGLQSIYAPENERVRAEQARVAELSEELQKMGGVGQGAITSNTLANQLYPSLRELPLMGSEYMDLSRRVTTLESVYEILTREYELAKVEEAREIPSVKVLDFPALAEKRAFPRRKIIVAVGLFITLLLSAIVIYIKASWDSMNRTDPRKVLVSEVMASMMRIVSWPKKTFAAKTFQ